MFKALGSYFSVGSSAWAVRRRLVVVTIVFCMAIIVWAGQWVTDTTRAQLLMNNGFYILFMILSVYLGGATVDDMHRRKFTKDVESAAAGDGGQQ